MEPDTPPKGIVFGVFGVSSIFIYPKYLLKYLLKPVDILKYID